VQIEELRLNIALSYIKSTADSGDTIAGMYYMYLTELGKESLEQLWKICKDVDKRKLKMSTEIEEIENV